MRLVSFAREHTVHTGAILSDGRVLDLVAATAAEADPLPADMKALLALGATGMERVRALVEISPADHVFTVDGQSVRLLAPVQEPGKALAIGLNYRAHALESGASIPEHPVVFVKLDTTLVGPGDAVELPAASNMVDWEGELVVVIGREARHVGRDRAMEHVAGYMNGNDVSVRDWQRHAATWTMGKNFDTHGPTGPWLVTADEVPNPEELRLRTWVNGDVKQDTLVGDLIFSIPELIEYLSTATTLRPGDLIFTGTPSGVGAARDPREFLKAGDVVSVEVDGDADFGRLENICVASVR